MNTKARHTISPVIFDQLPGESFRKAHAFWLEAKGNAELPPVCSIDPLKMPREILPDISLIAVEDGEKRLFVRLVGERIKSAVGFNRTHQWGEDAAKGEDVVRAYFHCIETRLPLYCEGPTVWSKHDYKIYKALLAPFAAPNGIIRRILTYLQFT
jgi:hypothetical protein